MKNIRLALAGLLAVLLALWLWADPLLWQPVTVMSVRSSLLNGTGVLAIGMMSVALLLALRPVRAEPWLGGLDKMYRLHRWLGMGAALAAVLHWVASQAPGWAAALGGWSRPARGARLAPENMVEELLHSLRGPAEGLGEWAFYGMLALTLLALVKRFPYHAFFQTHRLMAVAYALLVFHALVLMPWAWWGLGSGALLALLMAAGSVAAATVLTRRVGLGRRAVAQVTQVVPHTSAGVLELSARLQSRWQGHKAGQFAFVTFDGAEGAHPFTIVSAWRNDGEIRFLIKALGDYTRRLPGLVKVGDLVQVEGPYGRFNFDGEQQRQVWVGGGIGITPFVARLKQLAAWPDGRKIDLFYTTTLLDADGAASLRADAQAAGVNLHVMVDADDGRLDARRLTQAVPDWRQGSVWFCGPAGFGRTLRHDLVALGLPSGAFHQELFEMR